MYTALQSSRAFAYQVARDYDTGHKSRIDAASCLLHASEAAVQVALEAIQTLGGNGYINEYPAGRILLFLSYLMIKYSPSWYFAH